MRGEQAALQQSLEALGRNLAEASERSALLSRDVGSALGRASLSMQETLESLADKDNLRPMPLNEARSTVDALNGLALALLENSAQVEQSESATGLNEAMKQLADLALEQGSLNARANSLLPLDLGPPVMSRQLQQMAEQQRQISNRLNEMNQSAEQEQILGELDEMMREAEEVARMLDGGRLSPDVVARQERLFHRLLDAGRTLEREEYSSERVAERPGRVGPSRAAALDAELLDSKLRFPVPSPDELRQLPAAYRRLILDYFDRLNRGETDPAAGSAGPARPGGNDSEWEDG